MTTSESLGDGEEPLDRAANRLRAEEQWAALVEVQLARIDHVHEAAGQVPLLVDVAQIFEARLGEPERAYTTLVTAVELQPPSNQILEELKRLAGKAHESDDHAIAALQSAHAAAPANAAIARALIVVLRKKDRWDDLAPLLRALVEHNNEGPGETGLWQALGGHYRKEDRWEALADLLALRLRASGRAGDAEAVRRLRFELGDILADKLTRLTEAIETIEPLLAATPLDKAAARSLQTLYRRTQRHPDALALLQRLAEQDGDPGQRITLWHEVAAGWESTSGGERHAALALENARALGDESEQTMARLASFFERMGNWRPLVGVLDRMAAVAADPNVRLDASVRAGVVLRDELQDPAAAAARYALAHEANPRNPALAAALASLRQSLGDGTGAMELYQQARAFDPSNVTVAERLAALLEARELWADLEPVLDFLASQETARGEDEDHKGAAASIYLRLGACAHRRGDGEKAIAAYAKARRLLGTALPMPALRALAGLFLEKKNYPDARQAWAEIDQRAGELSASERVAAAWALGTCEAAMSAGEGDYKAALAAKRKLLASATGENQARLWHEIGELQHQKLSNPSGALAAYDEALRIDPTRRTTLHQRLELLAQLKQWPVVVQTLADLASREQDPAARAHYHYSAAVILRDEIKDAVAALPLFERTLDATPGFVKAFDAIERILIAKKEWRELRRAHRRMLKRVCERTSDNVALQLRLWDAIADLSLRHCDDRASAQVALEAAARLDPGNLERQERLGHHYVEGGESAIGEAIAQQQVIVAGKPDQAASYQTLRRLFMKTGASGKVWWVEGALDFLGHGSPAPAADNPAARPAQVIPEGVRLSEDLWKLLGSPWEDARIGDLFALAGPYLVAAVAGSRAEAGLATATNRIALGGTPGAPLATWYPALALGYVARVLDIPPPELYTRANQMIPLTVQRFSDNNTTVTAFVAGQPLEQRMGEPEIMFDLARKTAALRPGWSVAAAFPSAAALEPAWRAVLDLSGVPFAPDTPEANANAIAIEKLAASLRAVVPQSVVAQMKQMAARSGAADVTPFDLEQWLAAADLGAIRVAFFITGDLAAAARVLASDPDSQVPVAAGDRMGDIVAFSVSDAHFAARAAMGLEADLGTNDTDADGGGVWGARRTEPHHAGSHHGGSPVGQGGAGDVRAARLGNKPAAIPAD